MKYEHLYEVGPKSYENHELNRESQSNYEKATELQHFKN